MQGGRAREDAILLHLDTIMSAASKQRSGVVEAFPGIPAAFRKTLLVEPKVGLQLPTDDLGHTGTVTGSEHHLDAANKSIEVKARAATRELGKSGGSVHWSRKTQTQVEMRATKELISNQSGGSEIYAGGGSKCDLVVFPGSGAQVIELLLLQCNCSEQCYTQLQGLRSERVFLIIK